jgi:hypothetical protein
LVDGTRSLAVFDDPTPGMSPLGRGYHLATKAGWWVTHRGLFRAEAFHRIGGLKHHDEGEFSADWPWLLHMAILGEFERVPEPLCQKFYQKTSLSMIWERNASKHKALVRSCIREVRLSHLGLFSKAALIAYLKLRHSSRILSLIPRPLKTFIKRLFA